VYGSDEWLELKIFTFACIEETLTDFLFDNLRNVIGYVLEKHGMKLLHRFLQVLIGDKFTLEKVLEHFSLCCSEFS
jgi:hypothetical protein